MTKTTKIAIGVVLVGAAGGAAYWYLTRDETMALMEKAYAAMTDSERQKYKARIKTLTDAERKIANKILRQIIANQNDLLAKMTVEEQTVMEIKIGVSMAAYFPMSAELVAIQPK